VGVVSLSNDAAHLEQSLQAVFAEAENVLGRDLVDHNLELL
jgi:predicted component of type VI protein secretion system